jgi:hypothetical protein
LDAEMKARREEIAVMRNKWVNDNRDETLACQEMEAHQEEKKPTSPDRKAEAAQKDEVPAESAEVMPVGEPKKKRCRDRKLPAERRRQELKDLTWENSKPQKKLATARRGTSHRVEVARKMQADKKMPHRATVARRMRDILRLNTTRRAKVARCKENSVEKNRTRDKVMLGTLKGWTLGRDNRRNCNVTRGTRIEPYRKMTGHETAKRITESPVPSQNIKNWTLWRGRPPPKRKKGKGLDGRNRW